MGGAFLPVNGIGSAAHPNLSNVRFRPIPDELPAPIGLLAALEYRLTAQSHERNALRGAWPCGLNQQFLFLPRSHQFRANVSVTSIGDWQLDSDPTGLWLTLPRSAIEELLQELPRKEGLEHEFETNGSKLGVAFEVDMRKEKEQKAA